MFSGQVRRFRRRTSKLRNAPLSMAAGAILFAISQICSAVAPLRQSPQNPHYLEWRGQPIVLVSSGEHYGALINADFDYVAYFEELAAHDLNHARIFVGTYRSTPASFGITNNTLSPAPGRFICPWARSDEAGAWDGGKKFDLSKWDEAYFKRLRDLTEEAQKRDIILEFVLFCPMYEADNWEACPWNARNNVSGIGDLRREEVLSFADAELVEVQLAVVEKLVREINRFGNFYYEICNEPYARDVPMHWQERIIQCVRDTEDPHLCNLCTPPLSSVDVNPDRIGYEAAKLLHSLMRGERPPDKPQLLGPPRGIAARLSTDTLYVDDADVAEAIRFVRKHAAEGITVKDVVLHSRRSQSTLERRMKKALGRTIQGELTRVRISRAKALLYDTDLSIANIAEQSGFREPKYFSEVFRQHEGITATDFRRNCRAGRT